MKTIKLPFKLKYPALACGADMKGAFAVAVGDKAYLGEGFGDLSDPRNLVRYEKAVKAFAKKPGMRPKTVICDMHPGYFSTRFAESYEAKARHYKVQHHEAHIASAVIDNGIAGNVIGVAFDGTGFGRDGAIWGGEFFVGSPRRFERAAHLEYVRMPGSEAAIRQPWRMAASYMYKALGEGFHLKTPHPDKALFIKTMIDEGINSPLTSSAGRLFDAAGSMILGKDEADFEAQLPISLEKMAPSGYEERYEFDLKDQGGIYRISPDGMIRGIVRDISRGLDRRLLSGKFHNTVAKMIAKTIGMLGKKHHINKAVLSGGVFQNRYLVTKATEELRRHGFVIYTHSRLSTTDAGIPIGQIAIAKARGICA